MIVWRFIVLFSFSFLLLTACEAEQGTASPSETIIESITDEQAHDTPPSQTDIPPVRAEETERIIGRVTVSAERGDTFGFLHFIYRQESPPVEVSPDSVVISHLFYLKNIMDTDLTILPSGRPWLRVALWPVSVQRNLPYPSRYDPVSSWPRPIYNFETRGGKNLNGAPLIIPAGDTVALAHIYVDVTSLAQRHDVRFVTGWAVWGGDPHEKKLPLGGGLPMEPR
jgi:hypothetical protein